MTGAAWKDTHPTSMVASAKHEGGLRPFDTVRALGCLAIAGTQARPPVTFMFTSEGIMDKLLRDCHQAAKEFLSHLDDYKYAESLQRAVKAVDDEQVRVEEWRRKLSAGEFESDI